MYRLSAINWSLRLGLSVALLAMLTGAVFAAEPGDAAGGGSVLSSGSVSNNAGDVISRNLREDLLKERLRDRIFQPLHSGQDSLDAAMSPFVPQARSLSPGEMRKLKQEMDRKGNWNYSDPDNEGGGAGAGDSATDMNSNDATERDTLAILKRQYRNEEANQRAATNQISRGRSAQDQGYDPDSKKNDSNFSGKNRAPNNPADLRSSLNVENLRAFEVPMPSSVFKEVFSPSRSALGSAGDRSSQRKSDFQSLLDGGSALGGVRSSAMNPLGESAGGGYSSVGGDAGGIAALTPSLPRMATMPGYNPSLSSESSLSPSLASPAAAALPSLVQPRMSSQFNGPSGPPRRQF